MDPTFPWKPEKISTPGLGLALVRNVHRHTSMARLLSQGAGSFQMGGSCNYTQAACRVLDGDSSPTRMRVSGSVIRPEAERNCLPRRSPSRTCHRLLPGDSQVWPRIPGKRGKGGVSAPRALARPRGDRKPGHRGLSLASTAQPRLGRKFCGALSAGCIVEQETGHRRSRAVEQAAPDADPTRVCRDKWKLGQRAKVLRCPGRAGLREEWRWGGWR